MHPDGPMGRSPFNRIGLLFRLAWGLAVDAPRIRRWIGQPRAAWRRRVGPLPSVAIRAGVAWNGPRAARAGGAIADEGIGAPLPRPPVLG